MEQHSDKKLFTEFPPVSTSQWEEKIAEDLKGADYQKKLVWKTQEGFNIKPYYRAEDLNNLNYLQSVPGEFPFVRGNESNNWEIRQDVAVENIDHANKYLLQILDKGVTAPGLKINSKIIDSKEKLNLLLKNLPLERITLNILSGNDSPELFDYLVRIAAERKLLTSDLKGSFNFDPVGNLTVTGNFVTGEAEDFKQLANLIEKAAKNLPSFRVVTVNGLNYCNACATIVQDLAFTLSAGNCYLAKLTDTGFTVDTIAERMQFIFGVGTDYFMEIAKLRAARLLWSKIVEAYGPGDTKVAKMHIHAVIAEWNKTVFDPCVNMLRSTTETMAAALGGANSIEVTPFDSAFALCTDFSSRIARNTQIILKEETYFDKVTDPSAGSYYIENLTDNIASHAWELFLKIEDNGGYIEAFKAGIIQESVAASAEKKLKNVAARKEILVGTNQYPHFSERMTENIEAAVYKNKNKPNDSLIAEPLKQRRVSEELDDLRLQTENAVKRPKIFMLTIGNAVMRKARAAFSANFFACAGYEILDNIGFQSVEEGVDAALKAKADLIVLCSSDDEYAVFAPEAYNLVKSRAILVVAGEPACKPELESKGIKNYISLKSNLIESLKYYHKLLGLEYR